MGRGSGAVTLASSGGSDGVVGARRRARLAAALTPGRVLGMLVAFAALLVVQTPLAIAAYQYLHLPVGLARASLLVKDAAAASLVVVLALAFADRTRIRWFDVLAVAYAVLVATYAVVPFMVGTDMPPAAAIASVREFVMPVELYALGRLATASGLDPHRLLVPVLVIGTVAAASAVLLYVLVPVEFWSSTLDLVTFEREVQGLPRAISLWDIGLLGQYGVGDTGTISRAIGPFTHPVGAASYFVVPLVITASAALARARLGSRQSLLALAILTLTMALIGTISRGPWVAAVFGVVIVGVLIRRPLPALAGIAVAVAFVALVPPFSYSVRSALLGSDSSVQAHVEAVDKGIGTVIDNPMGIGLGNGDQMGDALATEGGASGASTSAGVGENLYLALYVSTGPLGLLTFLGWVVGAGLSLWSGWRPSREAWAEVGLGAVLVGLLATSITASHLMRFTTAASFWLLVGMFVQLRVQRPGLNRAGRAIRVPWSRRRVPAPTQPS
jgi:hypothetical protein